MDKMYLIETEYTDTDGVKHQGKIRKAYTDSGLHKAIAASRHRLKVPWFTSAEVTVHVYEKIETYNEVIT